METRSTYLISSRLCSSVCCGVSSVIQHHIAACMATVVRCVCELVINALSTNNKLYHLSLRPFCCKTTTMITHFQQNNYYDNIFSTLNRLITKNTQRNYSAIFSPKHALKSYISNRYLTNRPKCSGNPLEI